MTAAPGTTIWFARHESRLAWRDWLSMITAGRRERLRRVAIAILVFAVFMHFVAYWMVGPYADAAIDKSMLVTISGSILLSWLLMVSQAMETMTRAFYSRSDLDLILASPVAANKLFAIRITTIAIAMAAMAVPLAAPFINILIVQGGWHWLGAYGLIVAMGATSTALAVGLTVALFRLIGPKRTRLTAQIVAAVIGAAFVIGLQVAAILSYGTISRASVLQSQAVLAHAPDLDSIVWWPARAALGDIIPLVGVLALGLALLGIAIVLVAPRFGEYALVAAGTGNFSHAGARRQTAFRPASPQAALRRKEWLLLRRDPWLVSQTLMQMLYLIPPAVLLWHSFDNGNGAYALLVPVLVMASGQLAGGLAWLTISGEDAPDLVATAPVPPRFILRAKVEAVLGVIGDCLYAAGRGARLGVALACADCGCRDHHCHSGGDVDPALVSRPVQAQPVPPPSGILAGGDFRRGFFVDWLGGNRRCRLGKPHIGCRSGDPRLPRRPRRPLYGASPKLAFRSR